MANPLMAKAARGIRVALCLIAALLLAFSCTDNAEVAIQQVPECVTVCGRFQECTDKNYDSSSCADRCSNNVTANPDRETSLRRCNDCITDKTCSGLFEQCDCSAFVP